jgi:hypothetical protein
VLPPGPPWTLPAAYRVPASRLDQARGPRFPPTPVARRRLWLRAAAALRAAPAEHWASGAVHNLTYSPGGCVLVAALGNGDLTLFDPVAETEAWRLPGAHAAGVNGARFAGDRYVVTGAVPAAVGGGRCPHPGVPS